MSRAQSTDQTEGQDEMLHRVTDMLLSLETTSKTPISVLQEIMMLKKIPLPIYELIIAEDGTHDNTFVYRVSCDNKVAIGKGSSKKEAKQRAANSMLLEIAQRDLKLPISIDKPSVSTSTTMYESTPEPQDEHFGDAVNDLDTLCLDNNICIPEYQIIREEEFPNNFVCQCKINIPEEMGNAETEQQAKQIAAERMLNKLKSLTTTSVHEKDSRQNTPKPIRTIS
ncbi:interferon-inducible double-stranded RNA-dependent protein kinase activator A homolog, partial [Ceratina calcarata]|uniref:Interferon-inducible double-stranded RNA-dependent protein kinase activator A homolog n=1 Tax=Ceratina calcarata TaxID=156304 RepID=A0AAJ7N533_9HYME